MKKQLLIIFNLLFSIISFVLSNAFNNLDNNIYSMIFLILGIIFMVIYSIRIGYLLNKKITTKNSILIGMVPLLIYTFSYIVYMTLFNITNNLNFNIYSIFLIIFYMSFLNLILVLVIVFYYWNINKMKKDIIYFLAVTITLLIVLLIGSNLFKSLPLVIVEAIKFIYFTSIILLVTYILTIIFYKILKPFNK